VSIKQVLTAKLALNQPTFSCEFFPPKTSEGETTLWNTLSTLQPYSPDFVSVTYGAGGSTQDLTLGITARITAETSIPVLAHLTCVGASATELEDVIDSFKAVGVTNILALRGDPVTGPGTPWVTAKDGFTYSIELVEMLRSRGDFSIGVAAFPEGHPESHSLDDDAKVLAAKQHAGADFGITNLFFSADKYFDMVDRASSFGCDFPILPGLMPVTNVSQIQRFAALSGAEFPADLAARFEAVKEDSDAVKELGIEITTELSEKLLAGGAPGIHLYTLNHSTATRRVFENLGVKPTS
jgi:methylenetetrahydrofolate reductase (NADPH)